MGFERLGPVDLEVFPGEIVGVAGVGGNGQDELVACSAGLAAPVAGDEFVCAADTRHADDLAGEDFEQPAPEAAKPIASAPDQAARLGGVLAERGCVNFGPRPAASPTTVRAVPERLATSHDASRCSSPLPLSLMKTIVRPSAFQYSHELEQVPDLLRREHRGSSRIKASRATKEPQDLESGEHGSARRPPLSSQSMQTPG